MKRILTGPRFVAEALRGGARQQVHVVYVHEADSDSLRELRALAEKAKVRVEERSRAVLDELSKGVRHQGVVAITGEYPYVELSELLAQAGPCPLLVALDNLTDPHNFGAIVRSAVAFGAHGLLVPKHNAVGVTPVVVRVSAGATERARITRVTNLQRTLMTLRDQGLQIVGLDGDGDTDIYALPEAPEGRVVVIGSEGDGMRRMVRERCDVIASIPISGEAESLNASVAAGIALSEARRQMSPARTNAADTAVRG
ncbi:MAG: 23S rRNA (guanosine(2251)-2'-O)-methyltransferase RlmB [Sandaracinaceae bacterium]|nr:23S rRNA (guanosine(2251)-2'-O)-methyltransferase RlmB [Sandaracinaceae bacterium]